MDKVSSRLTVFFEEPFWIGVFERISEGKLSVCKVTFGAEPKDCLLPQTANYPFPYLFNLHGASTMFKSLPRKIYLVYLTRGI